VEVSAQFHHDGLHGQGTNQHIRVHRRYSPKGYSRFVANQWGKGKAEAPASAGGDY